MWTYHIFEKLKVVIMGNGYGFLSLSTVEKTFLLGDAEYDKRDQPFSRRTNLCNIVQNPNERVIILERISQIPFSTNSHRKTTYFFINTWNLCRLYLTVSAVIRVVRLGFCCSSDWFGPEEYALCAKAPDENALIPSRRILLPSRGWILPSGRGWILLYI